MREIVIDPVTRLEGHGKITIFLNDAGNVENAYFQVPELRGFERFCEGRKAEDLPIITTRICGVCPVAHHMAGAKAVDAAFNAELTEPAKNCENSSIVVITFTITYCTSTSWVAQTLW